MDNLNQKTIYELIDILEHIDITLFKKIPTDFLEYLYANKNNNYSSIINFQEPDWDLHISEETQAIIALLYKNYFASESEKEEILQNERLQEIQEENEKREKYNPDNIFKKKK